ncbi:MAG TPA: hypothetical protein VH372_17360 [Actinospica sp.]|nr:hypothetical protein [Actinospica sp.]
MRPRLLPDVHFLPTDDGLSVRAPGHEAALHAPGLYPWFERVSPFLDGEHSVVDLVEKLSPPAAQRVLGLVEFLLREGFARDAAFDLPHTLSPAARSLHAGMIEYLARLADSPERRFQSYRECAPVTVGSGRLLAGTVLALLASGVGHVRVHMTAEAETDRASLAESIAPLLHRDPGVKLEYAQGEPVDLPADAGALLYVSDRPDPARAGRMCALANAKGLRYGSALPDGDSVVIEEVAVPKSAASAQSERVAAFVPAGRYYGGPAAALAANQLCRNLLRHAAGLTDLDAEREPGPTVLELPAARFRGR